MCKIKSIFPRLPQVIVSPYHQQSQPTGNGTVPNRKSVCDGKIRHIKAKGA